MVVPRTVTVQPKWRSSQNAIALANSQVRDCMLPFYWNSLKQRVPRYYGVVSGAVASGSAPWPPVSSDSV